VVQGQLPGTSWVQSGKPGHGGGVVHGDP
jgi:hypothetical protein